MAKTVKTNNVLELLKAKGISTKATKGGDEVVPRETYRHRLYDLVETEHKVDTNGTQSGHKRNTKWTQTEHKVDTNGTQTEHKVDTALFGVDVLDCENKLAQVVNNAKINGTQTEHKQNTNRTQIEHKPNTNRTQIEHKPNTNRTQIEHKPNTNRCTNFGQEGDEKLTVLALGGLQKMLMIYFFNNCKLRATNVTHETSTRSIANHLNIATGSIKTTIARLIKKGLLRRVFTKIGRAGWANFEIPESVFKELVKLSSYEIEIEHKPNTNRTQTPTCSSSIITTTEEKKEILIPRTLEEMGVKQKSFKDVLVAGLSILEIEESLEAFAHDFSRGLVKSENPLSMLFGVLRKGQPYLSPAYAEKINRDVNEALQRAELVAKKRSELDEAKFKTAFNEWAIANPDLVTQITFSADFSIQSKPKLMEAYLMSEYRKLSAIGSEIDKNQ